MKKTMTLIFSFMMILGLSVELEAQEVRSPLAPQETNEVIPVSPGEGWSWVKAHWAWDGGKYKWKKGMYVETRKGYIWMDGEWERNQKSGWWKYNPGYWQKASELSEVKNDENTSEEMKKSKEKRHENKSGGLYIKTGSSK